MNFMRCIIKRSLVVQLLDCTIISYLIVKREECGIKFEIKFGSIVAIRKIVNIIIIYNIYHILYRYNINTILIIYSTARLHHNYTSHCETREVWNETRN